MIDIHCHILPGIDDGPAGIDESVEMAAIACRDGITRLAATPHVWYDNKPAGGEISEGLERLRQKLNKKDIPLELMSGADLRLSYELMGGMERGDVPTVNGSRYFLLELPDLLPPGLDRFFGVARMHGYVPVITHPERNHTLLVSPEKVGALRRARCLFQFTAMSFTGGFGDQVRGLSRLMLKRGFVDLVASDAHGASGRAPVLSAAGREISRLAGAEDLKRIFYDNPLAVVENRELFTD